jgi:hypothetical protein
MELYRRTHHFLPPDGEYTAIWWWKGRPRTTWVKVEESLLHEYDKDYGWRPLRFHDTIKVVHYLQLTEEDLS